MLKCVIPLIGSGRWDEILDIEQLRDVELFLGQLEGQLTVGSTATLKESTRE